jgi:hypothetical protein
VRNAIEIAMNDWADVVLQDVQERVMRLEKFILQ